MTLEIKDTETGKRYTIKGIGYPRYGEPYLSDVDCCIHVYDKSGPIVDVTILKEIPWKPKEGEEYHHIAVEVGLTVIRTSVRSDDFVHDNRVSQGNCFKTKDAAEIKLKEILEVLHEKV